ncbi:hypothetical protein A4G99_02140 [Haladaptatus sp. R4]|uniref:hypothetical protein n=1 Tax=Haladaptatus sp. R4 TaxID=1679489 RepID=UPI0007B47201|nr:hypothetical protein [Haladaptatus sp. R4]KZN25326.1 hypothetical protein A4G99_02140 [Haladaptatus sp. R4]
MADPDSESAPDSGLAAIRRKLNWLTAAVILLFVIEISRFVVGTVSISGNGSTLIVLLGGGIVALAALLVRLTPKYE